MEISRHKIQTSSLSFRFDQVFIVYELMFSDLRSELPVSTLLLFDIYDLLSNADASTIETVLQNEILRRMLNGKNKIIFRIFFIFNFKSQKLFSVMEFINDVNVETIQNMTPYCCKTYEECKHQVAQERD